VPAFEDTWIECLGDLARYRMAIEDEDLRDREVWSGVARYWYNKAADKSPRIGRIQHHLAVLARPNALQQLFYYTRALTCIQPFLNARESILTLFNPILEDHDTIIHRCLPIDIAFVKAHGILFKQGSLSTFDEYTDKFLSLLDNNIGRVTAKWREQGVWIASSNFFGVLSTFDTSYTRSAKEAISMLFDPISAYDISRSTSKDTALRRVVDHAGRPPVLSSNTAAPNLSVLGHRRPGILKRARGSSDCSPSNGIRLGCSTAPWNCSLEENCESSADSLGLISSTLRTVVPRIGDKNVLPHVHVLTFFVFCISILVELTRYGEIFSRIGEHNVHPNVNFWSAIWLCVFLIPEVIKDVPWRVQVYSSRLKGPANRPARRDKLRRFIAKSFSLYIAVPGADALPVDGNQSTSSANSYTYSGTLSQIQTSGSVIAPIRLSVEDILFMALAAISLVIFHMFGKRTGNQLFATGAAMVPANIVHLMTWEDGSVGTIGRLS
jgi:hypothetical protein